MSAVSGLASKGEKGRSKFQSLDINSLYRSTLGESAEPQQKTLPRKHGMQSLGKVPSARRPPANLPSLKSEHSGQEPPVSLVPSGGAGWGAKGESEEAPAAAAAAGTASTAAPPASSATNPLCTSVSGAPTPSAPSLPPNQPAAAAAAAAAASLVASAAKSGAGGPQEKLWSSLMSGGSGASSVDGGPSFLAHQNPMFQQEFPSLSTDQQAAKSTAQDVQYGPGPSLRPQTEGSWIQGGMARSAPVPGGALEPRAGGAQDQGKGNSGPLGAAQPASGPAGPGMSAPLPAQLRGIIPPFMYRGSQFGPGGGPPSNFPQNFQGNNNNNSRQRYPEQQRQSQGQRYPSQRPVDEDALFSRPIIKEEEFKQLDELVRDNGWATTDDIDYNQKLSFSDEEGDDNTQSRTNKQNEKLDGAAPRGGRGGPSFPGGKMPYGGVAVPPPALLAEDEFWREKRRQQIDQVALAVERAKQRKEEEEKRFQEQREAAAKKLQKLEEKMGVSKSETAIPAAAAPQPEKEQLEEKTEESWAKQVADEPVPVAVETAKEASVAFSPKFSEDLPPRFAKQKQQQLLRKPIGGGQPGQKGASPPPQQLQQPLQQQPVQSNTPPPLLATPIQPPANFEQRWNLSSIVGRGQPRRRSSQEQDDGEDKHRGAASGRGGRKVSEGSRGKPDEDSFMHRRQSSEEPVDLMKELPRPAQEQPDEDAKDKESKAKKSGVKLDAWSRGTDETLAAKLRGADDEQKLDKAEEERKGKGRGPRRPGGGGGGQKEAWPAGGNAPLKTWARTGSGETKPKGRGGKPKSGKPWADDESEQSGDEDKQQRKPKQQLVDDKKSGPGEKKNKEGFAPRGEPSRRGRGGAAAAGRPRGGMGRGIDGYGPPAKSPFGSRDENRKPDEPPNKSKLGGMVPLGGQAAPGSGKAAKQAAATPPRMQKDKSGRRKPRNKPDKPHDEHAEENWDSLTDSDDEHKASNHFAPPPTSKAPGAEKKNGLGGRAMNQSKKENLPLVVEAAKRLEKEKSALDALDISTYAAVTLLVDEASDADNGQFLYPYGNQNKSKKPMSQGGDKPSAAVSAPPNGNRGKFGSLGGPLGPQQQQQPQMKPSGKTGGYERIHDRSRASKLPPRLAKQKEVNRLNKVAANMGHHLGPTDMLDMYVDSTHMNSWDKTLADPLRGGSPLTSCVALGEQDGSGGLSVSQMAPGEALLECSTRLSQTIVFENTNIRSRDKFLPASALASIPRMIGAESKSNELPFCDSVSLQGEDTADMKLDFAFDSTELLDEKNKVRSGGHGVSAPPPSVAATSTISPSTAELNLKIASTKKVWEMPSVVEHSQDEFSSAGFEPSLESSFKEASAEESALPTDVSYSVGPTSVTGGNYTAAPGGLSATSLAGKTDPTTTSSNVCKVKPQQQQMAMSAAAAAGQSPLGQQTQLSPPPYNSTSASTQHLGYTTVARSAGVDNLSCWQHSGSAAAAPGFGGISAIPSPPTVLFNTNQQLQQPAGIYNAFQLDNSQRSQYSQYHPPYNLGSSNPAATGSYQQQNCYLPQGPPPPPPNAPGTDLYPPPSLSQYRLQAAAAPYGQTPQHVTSNPSTVLISSSSNSLMSASVKPSSQPIGAIGSKGYQTSAAPPPPQPSAMYAIYEHPSAANLLGLSGPSFMANSGPLVQRQATVQSNVIPTIQPPSSYFSSSAREHHYYLKDSSQGGFYQTNNPPPPHPNSNAMHNSSNPYAAAAGSMSGFSNSAANSSYAATQQMVAAAAAQGYRSAAAAAAAANYIKPPQQQGGAGSATDMGGRQLKSPAHEQLGPSVFSSGAGGQQMSASPKARGGAGGGGAVKQQPLQSPTLAAQQGQQHKFAAYQQNNSMKFHPQGMQQQNLVGGGRSNGPRGPFPTPIQRPNFQQNMSGRPRMPPNQQQQQRKANQGSNLLSKMDQTPSGGDKLLLNKELSEAKKPAAVTTAAAEKKPAAKAAVAEAKEEGGDDKAAAQCVE
ncbi:protein PRRC2A isoform X3 [Cloeon dipterum]|uniref:protein PRRC2A isoform X3 n=1 Tax=Cloeon dipterum TaxID=197152 RepID=UPI00322097EB